MRDVLPAGRAWKGAVAGRSVAAARVATRVAFDGELSDRKARRDAEPREFTRNAAPNRRDVILSLTHADRGSGDSSYARFSQEFHYVYK